MRPLVEIIRRSDRDLAKQVLLTAAPSFLGCSLFGRYADAASSVPLNIAEGNRRATVSPSTRGTSVEGRTAAGVSPEVREAHTKVRPAAAFCVAAGSADEVVAALRVAVAWGDLSYRETVDALGLFDRILAMLYRLIHGRGGKP